MVSWISTKKPPGKPARVVSKLTPTGTSHVAVRIPIGIPAPLASDLDVTNECLLALDRLLQQFKGLPRIEGFICAIADRWQPIVNALEDTKNFRSLDTATGVQLDRLGEFYEETRQGKTDGQYRAFLKTMAAVTASKGLGDEHLDALTSLDNGFAPTAIRLIMHYPAAFVMTCQVPFPQHELGKEFARILRKVVPSGVKFILLFEYPPSTTHFVWEGETGEGWAELGNEASTGGIWAHAV